MADNSDKPTRVKADSYATVYVNATLMGYSNWDIQIVLSKTLGLGGERTLEDQVLVIQSPGHAKAMLRSLEKTVAAYEAQHGVIREPDKEAFIKPETTKRSPVKRPTRRRAVPKQED